MELNMSFSQLSDINKVQLYIENVTPVINEGALFSDGSSQYRIPCEPMAGETVKIRFRTAKDNVDTVYFVTESKKEAMDKESTDELFDFYEKAVMLSEDRLEYYFEIQSGRMKCYFNKRGADTEHNDYYNFSIMPGFRTPDWAKGAVFYQIYVDRFNNGDQMNDVQEREYFYIGEAVHRVTEWDKYPASMGVREFYGGDLKGVKKKLDYLVELGIEVIYFNPLFVSPSNHKYDVQDYDYIDPHFGEIVKDEGEPLPDWDNSNEHATKYISRTTSIENLELSNLLFIELVEEAHKRGIKVILDGVFNHCGSFNKWLDREKLYQNQEGYEKGAYVDENSPYHTFFKFRDGSWPYNPNYDGWWGHDTLPKLNYEESSKLYDYILNVAKKWISPPFNVDGWRLDVAADLGHSNEYNHKFWKDFRKVIKDANPEALILAEHYGDPFDWLQGDEWDSVMNYDAFMEPVSWFLTGIEKHSDEFREDLLGNEKHFMDAMNHFMSRFNTQSINTAMNELSNHDHSRFLTRTNQKVGRTASMGPEAAEEGINKGVLREAVLIQMTWPGAPTIYYGDEAGVCGWTDPDNRRTYPWGEEDKELINLHKELIFIRKSYNALKVGSVKFLTGFHNFISYGRFDETDRFIIAVNNNNEEVTAELNVWEIGIKDSDRLTRLILTTQTGYELNAVMYAAENGILRLTLPAISSIVIKNVEQF